MKLSKKVIFVLIPFAFLVLLILLIIPSNSDKSTNCRAFYDSMNKAPVKASAWCKKGEYFTWKSTLPENAEHKDLNIFARYIGDKSKPAILLIHGFPTSSFDYCELVEYLRDDFFICLLDTPGYGFSDKPQDGFKYSIFDDAKLVDYFVREKAKIDNFVMLTHDKGDSVGLALLQLYQSYKKRPYTIKNHIMTNGSIYLPKAALNINQLILLPPIIGPIAEKLFSPKRVTDILSRKVYLNRLTSEEKKELASVFAYQSGDEVVHETIQYLNDRKKNEITWLGTLAKSDIPTTLIWAERDTIANPAIADYVWENYLKKRKTPAAYWQVACANHYIQNDQPEMLALLVKHVVNGSPQPNWEKFGCQPSLHGHVN